MQFISEEDYIRGEKNGLARKTMYERVYTNGWDVEKAITQPKKVRKVNVFDKMTEEEKELCEKNNLKDYVIEYRIKRGLSLKDAVSRLLNCRKHLAGKIGDIKEEHYKIAERNGINRKLVQSRYRRTGDLNYSITHPYNPKKASRKKR